MEENNSKPSSLNFPKWTLIWTLLAASIVAVLTGFSESLNEHMDVQPGLINLIKVMMIIVTALVWIIWLAFFSGHRLRFIFAATVICLMALLFYRFRVVFDGDLGFVRVESRFVERTYEVAVDNKQAERQVVELQTVSNYDFNQFLGNHRDGIVRDRVLDTDWESDPPEIVWTKSVGEGWSGFSAVNGFAITQEQRGQNECITCYEIETGELMWVHAAPNRHEDTMSLGRAGPRATPTIHRGLVYVQGATGILDCLNGANGKVIWSVDIAKLLGTEMQIEESTRGYQYQFENTTQSTLAWGRSGSPLVYQDKLIVTGGVGADKNCHTLIAFDKTTGTEIWRGGAKMIAYGSPAITDLVGQKQITLVAEDAAMGFDPGNGNVLWEADREGSSNSDANCSQVTRVNNNTVLLTKAYALGGELIKLVPTENGIVTESLWKDSRVLKTKMMSPVIRGDYAYSLSDGFLECTYIGEYAEQRRRVWRKRGRFGNGQLLLVGNQLLVHTEYGMLKLVEATPDSYIELGEIATVDGVCWNTICLYKNFLLVRSELEAACIRLKMEFETPELPVDTTPVDLDSTSATTETSESQ